MEHSVSISRGPCLSLSIHFLYVTHCVDSSNSRAKKRALQHQMCSKSADLALVTAEGKPVRREGPKWDAKRINQETLFVLGESTLLMLGEGGRGVCRDQALVTASKTIVKSSSY